MQNLSNVVIDPVRVGVEAAVRLGQLPAFPSQDWCDHASSTLAGVSRGGDVSVVIARRPGTDSGPSIEVVGGTDPAIRVVGDSAGPLGPLGWQAPSRMDGRTFLVSATPLHAAWASSSRGKAWRQLGVSDLMVGVERVNSSVPDRVVIVEVGLTPGTMESVAPITRVLENILPVLADRVALAFNGGLITPTTWLTSREQEVLEHIALGRTVREIAERIGRSPHTVHDHVKSLHKKLHATTRGELVARALGHRRLLEVAASDENRGQRLMSTKGSAVG